MVAELADCMQLLDLFGLGNQVKDGVESLALVGASKGAHDHNLAGLGRRLAEVNNLHEYDKSAPVISN